MVRVWLIEPALLIAPLCAVAAALLCPRLSRRNVLIVCAFLAALSMIGMFFNFSSWSWRSGVVNTLLGSLAYLSSVAVAYALVTLVDVIWLRRLLWAAFAVPIAIGLTLATIGYLGLLFIVGDSTPRRIQQLTPRYDCEIRLTGGAYTSDDTADVTFVRYFSVVPIQRVIWQKSYEEHQYTWGSNGPLIALTADHRHAIVTIGRFQGGAEQDIVDLP
jgi:hypothetical protein